MRIFTTLYTHVLRWARDPRATTYLALVSFTEAFFFPLPPDLMLIPMGLARVNKAWHFAAIATVMTTCGGVFGYILGHFAFAPIIEPFIETLGYTAQYQAVSAWLVEWGFWAVFIAGFTPIPYKLFTVASGVVNVALVPFIFASLIGRGARFFLVAGLIVWGGERLEARLQQSIERIGWTCVGLLGVVGLVLILGGCNGSDISRVPDINRSLGQTQSSATHVVQLDETIYSVAWRYDTDFKTLAQQNDLSPPYVLHPGQTLQVQPGAVEQAVPASDEPLWVEVPAGTAIPAAGAVIQPVEPNPANTTAKSQPIVAGAVYQWPAAGRVVRSFTVNQHKGIDIEGKLGDSVWAARDGEVVYSGDGIRGYGQLIIIKHDEHLLTAYAENRVRLVKEGDSVRQGQVIAEMGANDAGSARLHFEIREDGIPVDPLKFLP